VGNDFEASIPSQKRQCGRHDEAPTPWSDVAQSKIANDTRSTCPAQLGHGPTNPGAPHSELNSISEGTKKELKKNF